MKILRIIKFPTRHGVDGTVEVSIESKDLEAHSDMTEEVNKILLERLATSFAREVSGILHEKSKVS